ERNKAMLEAAQAVGAAELQEKQDALAHQVEVVGSILPRALEAKAAIEKHPELLQAMSLELRQPVADALAATAAMDGGDAEAALGEAACEGMERGDPLGERTLQRSAERMRKAPEDQNPDMDAKSADALLRQMHDTPPDAPGASDSGARFVPEVSTAEIEAMQ